MHTYRQDAEVQDWVKSLRQRYAGMKLIVGRDKLDVIQGVRNKIQAFEAFLDKYPEYQGKVVLIQVALQTNEENEAQGGVADVVSLLNSRFSTLTYQPAVFLHTEDLTFSQYLALLTVADAFMVRPASVVPQPKLWVLPEDVRELLRSKKRKAALQRMAASLPQAATAFARLDSPAGGTVADAGEQVRLCALQRRFYLVSCLIPDHQ